MTAEKSAEDQYADGLVALDAGEDTGNAPVFEMDEAEDKSSEPEVNQPVETSEEAVVGEEETPTGYQKLQSERDRLANEKRAIEQALAEERQRRESLEGLMSATVQQAQTMQQPQQQTPQGPPQPPEWFDATDANIPGTMSWQWAQQQNETVYRRIMREEIQQALQQDKQATIWERQLAEARSSGYPELTEQEARQKVQKYTKPGAITLKMLLDWESGPDREKQIAQSARAEGIETVSGQVAQVHKPHLAPVAGETRAPKKVSPEEKEEEDFVSSIINLDRADRMVDITE